MILFTDAFDGRIVQRQNYRKIMDLPNIQKLQETEYVQKYIFDNIIFLIKILKSKPKKNMKIKTYEFLQRYFIYNQISLLLKCYLILNINSI